MLVCLRGPVPKVDDSRHTERAEVVAVDDSALLKHGLVEFGTEHLTVRLKDGRIFTASNELRGQMELDKKFTVGDTALVIVPENADAETTLVARDHWRNGWLLALFLAFALLLIAFGGLTGAKALFSFVFSALAIWKLLIPAVLEYGLSPSMVTFVIVGALTLVIMTLVARTAKICFAATSGSLLGIGVALVLAEVVSSALRLNGATLPFGQLLLYSGYSSLDLRDVFVGAVILASSGAVMDLAMDVASAMDEVKRANPALSRKELFLSGLRVGRAVVGTMTTTLLLAYSGGYITLLMMFAAQGTHPLDFINSPLVAAELVKTLVGSFGLVLVAPFTAFTTSLMLYGRLARSES